MTPHLEEEPLMAEATIDQQFIEYIVKTLVGKPDQVRIERKIDERGVLLELYVDSEDLGRVIGRSGATAKSIRTLLRALGVKNDARYNLKIVDTNTGPRPARADDQSGGPTPAAMQPEDTAPVAGEAAADDTTAQEAPVEFPSEKTGATDAPAEPSEPAAPTEEQPPAEQEKSESDVERHRREISDLTGGLDI